MVDVRSGITVEPVGDVSAVLGEGPYWVPEDSSLLWVDIASGLLCRTDIPSGRTVVTEVGEATAVLPVQRGGVLVMGHSRLRLVEFAAGAAGEGSARRPAERTVAEVPARDAVRFNDAGVDPAGRVWAGTMHIPETDPVGELYRLDPGGVLTPVAKGVTVSNGLSWSPDGSHMYYADSPARRVDVFDYDPATGEAFQRRPFADLTGADGMPDGLTVDLDGCVWVAMWGGGVLRRFTPSGKPDAVVPMPVSKPTSCAFGGPDMADLYVTSAKIGLSDAQRAAEPLAGRLLHLRPGPLGLPSTTTRATLLP